MTLPKFEDYKAPWEVDSTGTDIPEADQKIDAGRLKKFLHNLLSDKGRLQESVTTVTGERDALQATVTAEARKGEDAAATAKREHEEAVAAAKAEGSLPALKLEAALAVEGITTAEARQIAGRLTGKTLEELTADAKSFAEVLGIGGPAVEGEEGAEPVTPARRPARVSSRQDPAPLADKLPDASDTEAMSKAFPRK